MKAAPAAPVVVAMRARLALIGLLALGLFALAIPVSADPPGTGGGVSCTQGVMTYGVQASCTVDGQTVGGPVTCGTCYLTAHTVTCNESFGQHAPETGCVSRP